EECGEGAEVKAGEEKSTMLATALGLAGEAKANGEGDQEEKRDFEELSINGEPAEAEREAEDAVPGQPLAEKRAEEEAATEEPERKDTKAGEPEREETEAAEPEREETEAGEPAATPVEILPLSSGGTSLQDEIDRLSREGEAKPAGETSPTGLG